jgi:energy-coupling factor transport system substrate-specific component
VSWQAGSALVVVVAAVAGMLWYESRRPSAKLVALVAALAALAVAARVLFAAVPNVQGTTDVVLLSGYVLGSAPGFMVGALAALASNLFLGQGPWTPWQMVGWGGAGVLGALLASVSGRRLGRWPLAACCGLAGLAFGAWMDLFTLTSFAAETSTDGYIAIATLSLPFNIAHAIGNFALCAMFGPSFVRVLERFRRRLHVRWVSLDAGRARARATVTTLLALSLVLGASTAALASPRSVREGVKYLERAQNTDGGFGGAPRQASNQLVTGWTVLGLEAAGRHPLDVRRTTRTPIDFIRSGVGSLAETGELERTILALRGAGLGLRRFGGRDLLADLDRKRRPDGSFSGLSNWTAFGIMALRASGRATGSAAIRRAASWLARQQNDDGGFAYATRGAGSFVDETAAALQGLAAAGRRNGKVVSRALAYLRRAQNADGGFGQSEGFRSNAQSTSWAVQGIVAARRAPASFRRAGRSPLTYLETLQQRDGSFRYSRSSTQTPVWVTAQTIAALARKSFPVEEPNRRRVKKATKPTTAAKPKARVAKEIKPKPRVQRPVTAEPRPEAATTVTATPTSSEKKAEPDAAGGLPVLALVGLGAVVVVAVGAYGMRRLN